ncbi:MAG: hypothetical protein ACRD4F_18395 [Candidatus Angelobacter sp.]
MVHSNHRLPHEVTVLQGQKFPRCAGCDDAVLFELVRSAPTVERSRIFLYELPVVDEAA